jgi:hypothetical protein
MPRAGFVREFHRSKTLSWENLFALKARWKVSLPALVRRAFELGLIDPNQYQRAYKYIHYKAWHKPGAEPVKIADEDPEVVASAFSDGGVSARAVAQELGWSPEVFSQISGVPLPSDDVPIIGSDVVSLSKYRGAKSKAK